MELGERSLHSPERANPLLDVGELRLGPLLHLATLGLSVGPDGMLGPISQNFGWPFDPGGGDRLTMYFMYDPTNGTLSQGNIYRAQGRNIEKTNHFLMDWFGRQ